MNIRFQNLLIEALHSHANGRDGRALLLLDEARMELSTPAPRPEGIKPEDDPGRTALDRAAWRAAR